MSDSLPLVRVLVSKYPVLYQKSNCENFDDAEEKRVPIITIKPETDSVPELCSLESVCGQACVYRHIARCVFTTI